MTECQAWRVLARNTLLERKPWLSVFEEDVLLPGGATIKGYLRAESRDYAMAFVWMRDGQVPLVRQYKHGIGLMSYDLPAGYLNEPSEDPMSAAQRELREETGIVAPEWRTLAAPFIDTNRGVTRAHLFLAIGGVQAFSPHPDPTESIEVSFYDPAGLRQMVVSGAINSLPTVAAIALALSQPREPGQ